MNNNDNRLVMALAYAAKGWPVFPVNSGKLPAIKDWEKAATTDPEQIKEWFDTLLIGGCNFGFTPGRAGIVVVDIDCNKKDKSGNEISGAMEWAAFQKKHGACTTPYKVATPSGGVHLYFAAADLRSKNGFLPAVDVKSCGGYVVIPGSRSSKGEYKLVSGGDPSPLPSSFIAEYGRHKAPASADIASPGITYTPKLSLDTPDKIRAAECVIEGWREADEGERNEQLYQMMREVCKCGVSIVKAKELYIARGLDKIGLDADSYEVLATIKSAYGNLSDLGANSAEMRAADVLLLDELPPLPAEGKASGGVKFTDNGGEDWADLEEREVPERRWFIQDWLSADDGYTVLFSGRGGSGKSLLMLELMQSLATGAPFLGKPVLRGSRAMYVSCEDSTEELARRIQMSRKQGPKTPRGVLRVWSRSGQDNLLVTPAKNGVLQEGPFMAELRARGKEFFGTQGGVLIIDTLADVYAGNEIDRAQVSQFVKRYLNRLGRDLGVTIIVVAHPAKSSAKTGQSYSGSSAWEGAFRCRWELNAQENGGSAGISELVLAKSNSVKAGERIPVRVARGHFEVVDVVTTVAGVKDLIKQQIDEAYSEKKMYGLSNLAKRPVIKMVVIDPLTGEEVLAATVKRLVDEMMEDGEIEACKVNGLSGLRVAR